MAVSFPQGPGTEKWLQAVNADSTVDIAVPLYLRDDEQLQIAAACILSAPTETDSQRLHTYYFTMNGWQHLSTTTLENDPVIHTRDLLSPTITFIGTDASTVKEQAHELNQALIETLGMGFAPYGGISQDLSNLTPRDECDCTGWDDSWVQLGGGFAHLADQQVYRCQSCATVHGAMINGKKRTLGQLFDPDWVFEDGSPDSIVEVDQDEVYLLYSADIPDTDHETVTTHGRIEHVVGVMNAIGGHGSASFSRYDPVYHKALLAVVEDEIGGYLTWESLEGMPTLRQLFVREPYRRQGIATTLLTAWCEELCEHTTYYIDEPNEKSLALFEKLGHFADGGSPYTAVETFGIRGVGNSLENATEVPQ